MEKIKAVILCGGLATRLGELSKDKPKILMEVNGRPFIDYLLHNLNWCDAKGVEKGIFEIDEVIFACGKVENGWKIDDHIETIKDNKLKLLIAPEQGEFYADTLLGTAGAVKYLEPRLKDAVNILVINGDSYISKEYLFSLLSRKTLGYVNHMLLGVPSVFSNHNYPIINFSSESKLLEYRFDKNNTKPCKFSSAGYYAFKNSILNEIPKNKYSSLENDILEKLVKNGIIYVQPLDKFEMFYDIGTFDGLAIFDAYATSVDLFN